MMNHFHEVSRDTPVVERCDVLVAGAGPAGVCAAIAAARAGASVCLIETHGCLGGVWTSGLLSWVLDAQNKSGILAELLRRLGRRDASAPLVQGGIAYDTEQMKLVLERMCVEAGVKVRLHTRVVGAARDENNRLAVALTESKSGREAWFAKVFIDCTGDGDLASLAGCGFEVGRPATGAGSFGPERAGETQPMTLLCLITGVDHDATRDTHDRTGKAWSAPKDALLAELRRAGVEPSYDRPTIFVVRPGLYAWMINHEYGVSGLSANDITRATLHARDELHRNIDALRSLGGGWKDIRIVSTADQIGVREARRVRGRYVVTLDDMVNGARHDDAVCRVTFKIDVHSTNPSQGKGIDLTGRVPVQEYDIPLRALIAADCDALLLAGRCISGDFLAHSSYRVTGNAAALGEAAGLTAALACKHACLPHDVPVEQVLAALNAPEDRNGVGS